MANISAGHEISEVLVDPQINLIYGVGCIPRGLVCSSLLSVVNGTSATLMKVTGLSSATAAIDRKTGFLYAAGGGQLVAPSPYGAATLKSNSDTCSAFAGMAVDPEQDQVILAPYNCDHVLVYDGLSGRLLNMHSLPGWPQSVAFNPVTTRRM
ncbi:MAG: hypothetical protein JRN06_09320 [Nitrososphaerota archaeon]|nr:hypothetical protein [Nitrososphaerota archaeon]MDG7024784.1 hypothetical protein [Nitrososphaerota archaeon]